MQKKKLTVESTLYEMLTFIIKTILGELYQNMHLHINPGPSHDYFIILHLRLYKSHVICIIVG